MPVQDTQLYKQIGERLDRLEIRGLFTEELLWGRPGNVSSFTITAAGEVLEVAEQARLGSVSIYRIDWPAERLPGVVARREVRSKLSASHTQEHVVCYVTADGERLAFSYARAAPGGGQEMRTLSYEVGSTSRTTVEQLAELAFSLRDLSGGEPAVSELASRLSSAFDVEALTKSFFEHYRQIFEGLEQGLMRVEASEQRRPFVQRLMGRLMFVRFLEEKGWVRLGGRRDYLKALWERYREDGDGESFYASRLKPLFFSGLNSSEIDDPEGLTGQTPYLNGGLFEPSELDSDERVDVPDEALEPLFSELLYRYNFTVTESTPFEVEVAVDPEMLGHIFEELVTGRHESGSYYTPKPVVSFMCREALKGHLETELPQDSPEEIRVFVEEDNPDGLHDPERALEALRSMRVCDPSCGSGAYLLGMLQELLELRHLLFSTRRLDDRTAYTRKLEIIQRNLYGVDLDEFAVDIAKLRLWLSLVVEDGRNPLDEPDADVSLPNLDFKIESGDSLTAPDPSGGLQMDLKRGSDIEELSKLKARFVTAHGEEKIRLRQQIWDTQREISGWAHPGGEVEGFDWQVAFAEIFSKEDGGGFDAVLANPPYVRMELFKEIKPTLRRNFPEAHSDRADLYVYFYARALQLLKSGGMLTFISSNKWFRANYGRKLRKHLADTSHVRSITDFGDLPVFQGASAYPMIFTAHKERDRDASTLFTEVESLEPPYPDVAALIRQTGEPLPPEAINGEAWLLTDSETAARLTKMRATSIPLGEYVKGQIYRGVVTGLNEAFVIDSAKREELTSENPESEKIIKPFLVGRNIRKYHASTKDRWLLYMHHGIDVSDLDAVIEHLKPFKDKLENRATRQEWYELQQPQMKYASAFEQPKIVFPDIAKRPRFAFDAVGAYSGDTTFLISASDRYLLGLLNSSTIEDFFVRVGATVRGGYLRFKTQYVEQIPVPDAAAADREAIAELVQQCLDASGVGCEEQEREIDERVARLYGVDISGSR